VSRFDKALGRRRNLVYGVVGALILLVLIALPPMGVSGFWLRTLTQAYVLAIMAIGWNYIGGYTGYAAFGNVAFFGLGAYVTGILMKRMSVPFFPSALAGALFAAGFAILIGLPVLRLKGHYFAIATLGVAEALREVVADDLGFLLKIPGDLLGLIGLDQAADSLHAAADQVSITNGPMGITLPFFRPESGVVDAVD